MPVLHYLFVMWDGGGTVPPELAVATQLLAAGHQVSVLGEESMRPEILAAKCRFIPYRYAPNRPDRRPDSDPFPDWSGQSPFQVLHQLLFAYAAAYAEDVKEACRAYPIDRVIADGFLPGAMIGAAAAGKPFSVLWPAVDLLPHPGRPPDGLGLTPGSNLLTKGRNHLLNFVFKKVLQGGRKSLNKVRINYGLAPLRHPFDQYRLAEKVLLLTSRYFDYPTRLPANTHYAGPQLTDPFWAEQYTMTITGPFVLVSLGTTFQNQQPLYQRLIGTLAQLPIPAVVTLGNVFEPEDFSAPAQVIVLKQAAHRNLLPQCGLVIHHGGHGITMKSIMAGLPQLVIPLGRDQLGNAARVVYHGIGLRVKPKAAIPELLRQTKALLADATYGIRARQMAAKINRELEENLVLQYLI